MKLIFPLLEKYHYQRAMVLGTPSYPAAEDKSSLKWRVSVFLISTFFNDAYREFIGLGTFIASQKSSPVKWTLFRVPFLTNNEARPVTATYLGSGEDGMSLSRKSMAAWVAQEMVRDDWAMKTPALFN